MKTPSCQNNRILYPDDIDNRFDNRKYWGRVPRFINKIEETDMYECNPEYIYLIECVMNGKINTDNISHDLFCEIEKLINKIPDESISRTDEENRLLQCLGICES